MLDFLIKFLNEDKMMKKAFLALFLTVCANPDVVQTHQSGDEELSCQALKAEMDRCEHALHKVKREKGVTGTNVAAVLFFWLVATHCNVGEAVDALNRRSQHLSKLS
jgi:hypothetical protein